MLQMSILTDWCADIMIGGTANERLRWGESDLWEERSDGGSISVWVYPSTFTLARPSDEWHLLSKHHLHEQQPETLSASLVICVPSASILKNINIEIRMIQARSQQITDCWKETFVPILNIGGRCENCKGSQHPSTSIQGPGNHSVQAYYYSMIESFSQRLW